MIRFCFLLFSFLTPTLLQAQDYLHLIGKIGADSVILDVSNFQKRLKGFYYSLHSAEEGFLEGEQTGNQQYAIRLYVKEQLKGKLSLEGKLTDLQGLMDSGSRKDSARFRSETIHSCQFRLVSSNLSDSVNQTNCSVNVNLLIPTTFRKKTLPDFISDSLIPSSIVKNSEQFAESILSDFRENAKSIDTELHLHYSYTAMPVYNHNGLLCYQKRSYNYVGGETGVEENIYTIFDLYSGKRYTFESIFPESEARYKLSILLDLKLHQEFPDIDGIKILTVSKEFRFSRNGIYFYYKPSEVGLYSLETLELLIPFSDLKPLLAKDHPFQWISEKP